MKSVLYTLLFFSTTCLAQRRDISLNAGWRTIANTTDTTNDQTWKLVDVPHNWDTYGGYRRLRHGNLHGFALYHKQFPISKEGRKRYFLWFEGVSSYATVWVNGKFVGYHAGGRTSFTLDITETLKPGQALNTIVVRADHPVNIRDLPWVCGADSEDRGFSEGSQPMGIFRPVHLVITDPVRIEPFGVHVWNDTTVSEKEAGLYLETEIKNYGTQLTQAVITQQLLDHNHNIVAAIRSTQALARNQTILVRQQLPNITHPKLWSVADPYLYQLITTIEVNGKPIDRIRTPYGIRKIHWADPAAPGVHPFLLNGHPVFLNGIAEYEHRLGGSHAFSPEEIKARVEQIRAAGFNAFRDAHQPHNLLYQHYWDSMGILWWPQLSAHVWYDSPEFRKNFLVSLTEWVKERRNSPSVILWGLQNESKLPTDFARLCSDLIRQLDPTASSQRLITTCNGGTGTDWDVPQNWTGTYGGDPATYASDLNRQVLVGEYGGWRSLGLHGELPNSEDRLTALMATKIRLADSVRDQVAGHFAWLYSSHDNPGRVQSGEGYRGLDRIGPVNYKGLLTSWEEPTDLYYLYRANFASPGVSPMVYIVSHTWPDRWTGPGRKNGLVVYSNCDEVELFNGGTSLGRRKKGNFQWDGVDIQYNVISAVAYFQGKVVAKDVITLHHLPALPSAAGAVQRRASNDNYLYRVNCGGPDYVDKEGNQWLADRHLTTPGTWGSTSWTDDFPGLPAFFASQRTTSDQISGTEDAPLFKDFRYGLDQLKYSFPVPAGDYTVELYFAEPWVDNAGWRLFDVAVNDSVVLKDLDIWKEAGHDRALKKVIRVHVTGKELVISFPKAAAGQAVISALAIVTGDKTIGPAAPSPGLISNGHESWLDTGDTVYTDEKVTFASLPPDLYGAEWKRGPHRGTPSGFRVTQEADVFITEKQEGYEDTRTRITTEQDTLTVYRRRYSAGAAVSVGSFPIFVTAATSIEPAYDSKPVTAYKTANARVNKDTTEWDMAVNVGDTYSLTIKYRWLGAAPTAGKIEVRMEDGTLIRTEDIRLLTTPEKKWNYLNSSTGTMINAGHYKVRLIIPVSGDLKVDELQVQ